MLMQRSMPRTLGRCLLAGGLMLGIGAGSTHQASSTAHAASTTLTFYDGDLYSTNATPQLKAIVAGYSKLHPDVTIKLIPYNNNYYTDISTALAGGTIADVVIPTAMQQIWTDASKGYWQDLTPYYSKPDPYLPNHESLISALLPSAAQALRFYDGKYYVLATTSVDAAFFYNKTIFAKAGIKSPPATWDQLISDFKAIKAAGYVPFEAALGDTAYDEPMPDLLAAIEAQVMGKTLKQLDTNHDGIVDLRELALGIKSHVYSTSNAEVQEALKLYASLYPYMQRGAAGVSDTQVTRREFAHGRAGVVYDGLWVASGFDTAKPKPDYGTFALPQVTAASSKFAYPGTHGTGIYGAGTAIAFAVPTSTVKHGHLAQAIDFIEYLMSYNATQVLTVSSSSTSLLKGAHNDPAYTLFSNISAHPSPLASSEQTFPPNWSIARQQLLVGYLTGQKSWNDMLTAMQKGLDTAASAVISTFHL
jgi:raffinose/stachyose/melibiose transport system substrate-binding protein